MLIRKLIAGLLLSLALAGGALAQSSPGFVVQNPPFVPSVGQWNGYFAGKQDYLPGGIPNSSLVQVPAKTLKGNNSLSSALPADLPLATVQTMLGQGQILGGKASGVNCNALADTAVTIASPTTNWTPASFLVVQKTGAGGTARVGVYSAISQGGVNLSVQQALPAASGVATPATVATLSNTAGFYTYTTIYFNVGTVQSGTCTVDFYAFIRPLP